MSFNYNFYDKWFLGGKDYTGVWRKYHAPIPAAQMNFTAEEEWFLTVINSIDGIERNFISDKNYINTDKLEGIIIGDSSGLLPLSNGRSFPFVKRFYEDNLLALKEGDFTVFELKPYSEPYVREVCRYLLGTYEIRCFWLFQYRDVKQPDLSEMNKRYQRNLDLISEKKSGLDKQVLAGLENIKQEEELPVAGINDNKALLALSEVLKLLEKAGIKEVHSLTVLPENPAREYLCIPVKINAILTYDQLKGLSDAVSNAPTLSIINFFAVTNCDLKMTDVRPLLEKGLPFYQARCMVIIEFITGLPDKK